MKKNKEKSDAVAGTFLFAPTCAPMGLISDVTYQERKRVIIVITYHFQFEGKKLWLQF